MKLIVREIEKNRELLIETLVSGFPLWPRSVAARCVLLMEQRAQKLPDGRVLLDYSPDVLDQALADEGLCFGCGYACAHPRRMNDEERALMLSTQAATDTLSEPDDA